MQQHLISEINANVHIYLIQYILMQSSSNIAAALNTFCKNDHQKD